eukprot:133377-Chlamydomonas_euryale.AAC.3
MVCVADVGSLLGSLVGAEDRAAVEHAEERADGGAAAPTADDAHGAFGGAAAVTAAATAHVHDAAGIDAAHIVRRVQLSQHGCAPGSGR